jgi:hypothetical protein
MKTQVLIETHTIPAYRAIRPALVAHISGYIGVCGYTFSATINQADFASLVDVVNNAAQRAGVHPAEYTINTIQPVSRNPERVPRH